MNITSVKLLNAIKNGTSDISQLMKMTGTQKWQFNATVKNLARQGYVNKLNRKIILQQNPKAILLRDIANHFDIEKLLRDSNEIVFYTLTEPRTIEDIHRISKLSIPSVYRSISELESIGALTRNDNTITIDKSKEQLYLFAKLLEKEREREQIEPYAELIYRDNLRILKRVPSGNSVEGELTAFSLFSDYGVDYQTIYDYYIQQEVPLRIEDVLIHAIIAAKKYGDKNSLTVSIIFYLKNKDKMELLTVREVAKSYGIRDLWLDIESYVRNNPISNKELFPPRSEFEEKAQLYNIQPQLYALPSVFPDLFKDIGYRLGSEIEAYLFGGENMRLKGLKDRTKDCDIAVTDQRSQMILLQTLRDMGYKSLNQMQRNPEDVRVAASDILEHPERSRIDIFRSKIAGKLILSTSMKKRARIQEFARLKLGILQNEDVFLLKGVTLREGDVQDMAKLVQAGNFDWEIVWNELLIQEDETSKDFSEVLLQSADSLLEAYEIRVPFYRKLLRRIVDNKIKELVRNKDRSLGELVSLLKGADVSETLLRNRINYLLKMKYIRRENKQGKELFTARKALVLSVPPKESISTLEKILKHIQEISTTLNYRPGIVGNAIDIAEKISKSHRIEARRPKAIAASILFLVRHEYDRHAAKRISYASGVNEATIYALSKLLQEIIATE